MSSTSIKHDGSKYNLRSRSPRPQRAEDDDNFNQPVALIDLHKSVSRMSYQDEESKIPSDSEVTHWTESEETLYQTGDDSSAEESIPEKDEDAKVAPKRSESSVPVSDKRSSTSIRPKHEERKKPELKSPDAKIVPKIKKVDASNTVSMCGQSFMILLIAVGVYLWHVSETSNSLVNGSRPVPFRYGNLTNKLEQIKHKYSSSNFDDQFWEQIVGSSWSHLMHEGSIKQPVVLMLVGQPGSPSLNNLAVDIGKMFSSTFTHSHDDIVYIEGSSQMFKETSRAKLEMDEKLKQDFDQGHKVALVSQFDQLPGCSVMLFHSYCDNDNAPYKDVVIIFTIELKRTLSDISSRNVEQVVQDHLTQSWSKCPEELTEDKITAMHSRVSNNIVLVS